jgi:transcriptional regulator with XRE-family HTH domain
MKRPSTAETVVKNIKMLLDESGWKVPQLSKISGVPKRTIYSILSMDRVPGIDTTDDIARAFGLTGWHLLMPDLHYELAKSGKLAVLIDDFFKSSQTTQDYIADVLKRERKDGTN